VDDDCFHALGLDAICRRGGAAGITEHLRGVSTLSYGARTLKAWDQWNSPTNSPSPS
jgi:hypothetical protein